MLARAFAQLSIVAIFRRIVSFQRLVDLLGRRASPDSHERDISTDAIERAQRVADIVQVASAYAIPRPNCLDRSLVLWSILARHGIDSDIRFGVSRDGEALEAHAWVEYRGTVLNDDPDVTARYTPMGPEAVAVTPVRR